MDSELRDLYQEVILDHNKNPRNSGVLEGADHAANGHNPLCGDQVRVELLVRDGRVEDVKFHGVGCAISTASASLMTESVKGRPVEEVDALFAKVLAMLTQDGETEFDESDQQLMALAGVKEFPMRVKCASLSWHTLQAALHKSGVPATTEEK